MRFALGSERLANRFEKKLSTINTLHIYQGFFVPDWWQFFGLHIFWMFLLQTSSFLWEFQSIFFQKIMYQLSKKYIHLLFFSYSLYQQREPFIEGSIFFKNIKISDVYSWVQIWSLFCCCRSGQKNEGEKKYQNTFSPFLSVYTFINVRESLDYNNGPVSVLFVFYLLLCCFIFFVVARMARKKSKMLLIALAQAQKLSLLLLNF